MNPTRLIKPDFIVINMFMNYEPAIGLEIHTELKTKTKMFCDSANDPNETHPNVNVCPVCMGHPGTLPVINKEAVEKSIRTGMALNCVIAEHSKFDRKNYFYPDLPKGYQISQYDMPLCREGWLKIEPPSLKASASQVKKIRIQRIHLEEDTGKLLHTGDGSHSLVDYNRAGVPLMELVTMPDLVSGDELIKFVKELQLIVRYLDCSDADMEKGQMRVEVNISIKKAGEEKLGTKVEIKNINSISAAARAVNYEIERQAEILEAGGKITQETRGWNENKGETFSQRTKEGSADYRYFPEPDLPPLTFTKTYIEELRSRLPELPLRRRKRFAEEYGLNSSQIEIFTTAKKLGDYFENVASEISEWDKIKGDEEISEEHKKQLYVLAANYLITQLPALMNAAGMEINEIEGLKMTPENFAELVAKIHHNEISSTGAVGVMKIMFETGAEPETIIREKNLGQVSDESELELAVDRVLANNEKATEDYKKGKVETIKFLIGKIMAETHGKANPQIVEKIIEKKLKQ
ncbi:MAG: aspartyl-tRNA(Asn)/glutamyl-tRNA (Gln) amidotransferase subunit B [Parcubacteria group bacterium Licking1014_17]|nr:MAG: aspartyl-tRNA(Asn)/glutamyl-tRNA (Gln) amidotransferase subunit B [Parcubacteria group bacterium Licking1014_17]